MTYGQSNLRAGTITVKAPLILAAGLVLLPFVWIASTAFKRQIDILTGKIIFAPVSINFEMLLFSKQAVFLHNFANSVIIGVTSTAIVLMVSSMAAFSMHRINTPRWVTYIIMLWAIVFHMIPPITIVGAWFIMFSTVGLFDTYIAMILAHVTINLPMGLWLMSTYVREVPRELEEAAVVDGCSTPGLFFRIVLPLLRPGLVATCVLVFIFSWNDFTVALNLTSKATQTVPVMIATFAQEYEIRYGEMAAGAVLSTVPALLLLLIGQRYIVKGLLAGAVK